MEEDDKFEITEDQSEMQIPEDIETDETSSDEEKEVPEESDEDFGGSDFVPFSRGNSRETINPFLEQSAEPVENLERDLGNIPNRQTEDTQTSVFNAPQYSSRNARGGYYEQPTDDTYPEQIRPTQIMRSPVDVSLPFNELPKTRLLNPDDATGWRNMEDTGYPGDQKYKIGSETKKRRDVF